MTSIHCQTPQILSFSNLHETQSNLTREFSCFACLHFPSCRLSGFSDEPTYQLVARVFEHVMPIDCGEGHAEFSAGRRLVIFWNTKRKEHRLPRVRDRREWNLTHSFRRAREESKMGWRTWDVSTVVSSFRPRRSDISVRQSESVWRSKRLRDSNK